MAQTVEGFVNNALDEAKISPLHKRVIALIAAGYFCDVIDYTIYGSLVPFIIKSGFAATDAALIGSATIIGLAIGTPARAIFRPVRPQVRLSVQSFVLRHPHHPRRIHAERHTAGHLPLLGRNKPGRRAATRLRLCGRMGAQTHPWRILAIVHFIGGAMVWPIGTGLVPRFRRHVCFGGRRGLGRLCVARRVDPHWLLALIVWVFRFTLPESPRFLATHGRGDEAIKILNRLGICRPDRAAVDRRRQQHQERSVRRRVPHVPKRVIAGMICFTAFFGIAIGLAPGCRTS